MAFTVGYALLGALAVALLLIPGLAYMIYRKPRKLYHNRWLEKVSNAYGKGIDKIMSAPKKIFIPAGIVLLGAGILSYSVGKDFYRNLTKVLSGYRYSFHPEFHWKKLRK